MRIKLLLSTLAGLSLSLVSLPPVQANFNSLDLAQSSTSLSCVSWRPTGMCTWLRCTFPSGCSITTSLRYRHYLPDVVVSVYQDPDKTPWQEFRLISSVSSRGQSGATGSVVQTGRRGSDARIVSRMTDIVGNPMSTVLGDALSSAGIGCKTQITPMQPYFLSSLDYLSWKHPYVELLNVATFVPGLREVGFRRDGDDSLMLRGRWGHVYPRIGSIMHQDHFKASATIAQRAISIATDETPLHVVVPLPAQNSSGVWPPGPAEEWSSRNGKWQMIYPRRESSCAIFGDRDKYPSEASLADYRSDSGAYGWVYWRPWECCQGRGSLINTVRF